MKTLLPLIPLALFAFTTAHAGDSHEAVRQAAAAVEKDMVAWRRDIHQHPELGNRETRTAKLVADHLRALGFDEVHTGVAHTGVVGVLKGGKPGRRGRAARRHGCAAGGGALRPALRLQGARRVQRRRGAGVMHACGHDAHTAILMGVATMLAGMRAEIPGTVSFVFQPAEEGPPEGEEGGARLMLKEGLWKLAKQPTAIFGLHTWPGPTRARSATARGARWLPPTR